jgi:hypothetical protein
MRTHGCSSHHEVSLGVVGEEFQKCFFGYFFQWMSLRELYSDWAREM